MDRPDCANPPFVCASGFVAPVRPAVVEPVRFDPLVPVAEDAVADAFAPFALLFEVELADDDVLDSSVELPVVLELECLLLPDVVCLFREPESVLVVLDRVVLRDALELAVRDCDPLVVASVSLEALLDEPSGCFQRSGEGNPEVRLAT
ncbi:hypothetical protein [Natronosalvus hydrolyticus]|uniref:hypothetical protein n=1 Tax=Natronosalvus hydrolyticus TaxID=2979988 RepID=UPI00319DDEBB